MNSSKMDVEILKSDNSAITNASWIVVVSSSSEEDNDSSSSDNSDDEPDDFQHAVWELYNNAKNMIYDYNKQYNDIYIQLLKNKVSDDAIVANTKKVKQYKRRFSHLESSNVCNNGYAEFLQHLSIKAGDAERKMNVLSNIKKDIMMKHNEFRLMKQCHLPKEVKLREYNTILKEVYKGIKIYRTVCEVNEVAGIDENMDELWYILTKINHEILNVKNSLSKGFCELDVKTRSAIVDVNFFNLISSENDGFLNGTNQFSNILQLNGSNRGDFVCETGVLSRYKSGEARLLHKHPNLYISNQRSDHITQKSTTGASKIRSVSLAKKRQITNIVDSIEVLQTHTSAEKSSDLLDEMQQISDSSDDLD